ncbi:hypothetical protein [Mariniphaga sp.]|uniref:hypothetical protein n=1 Tax=Mariniphaga sp. TaxID=1954475 RepID=UPI0035671BB3
MKTLVRLFFIMAVISLVAGCNKTDEFPEGNMTDNQLKSADSRTINFEMPPGYATPIICDGEEVDYLEVGEDGVGGENLYAHATAHIINGKFVWVIVHVKGTLTSQSTGEIFKINEINKVTFGENEEIATMFTRTHAKGNKGTHVIMFFEVDWVNLTFMLTKGICPPEN